METTETILDDRFAVANVLVNECDVITSGKGNYWLGANGVANLGFVLKLGCSCSFTGFMLRNTFNAGNTDRLVT